VTVGFELEWQPRHGAASCVSRMITRILSHSDYSERPPITSSVATVLPAIGRHSCASIHSCTVSGFHRRYFPTVIAAGPYFGLLDRQL